MKKVKVICIILILGVLAAFARGASAALLTPSIHPTQTVPLPAGTGAVIGQEPQAKQSELDKSPNAWISRTYELKHISAEDFMKVAKIFVTDFTERGSTLVVWIRRNNIENFESLMKKLDVEKKTIQLKVYAVYARRKAGNEAADQKIYSNKTEAENAGSGLKKPVEKFEKLRVDLKYKNTSAKDIILFIAERAGLNLTLEADVNFPVTCDLKGIPSSEALDIILKPARMGFAIDGNTLRIFALHIQAPEPELKKVLDELKALWNFTSYEVDGPSFITLRESGGPANFKLVTDSQLSLSVANVKVKGEDVGKRTVFIERLMLGGTMNFENNIYIDTPDVSIKENGYLVAGVSGYGSATRALILVISAEIK